MTPDPLLSPKFLRLMKELIKQELRPIKEDIRIVKKKLDTVKEKTTKPL